MRVKATKPFGSDSVEIGISTWTEEAQPKNHEVSIRLRYTNIAGGFHTGSPEAGLEALFEMMKMAVEYDQLSAEDITDLITEMMNSICRQSTNTTRTLPS
jgi:hypothetical protein